ncbi:MAG: LysR family transcriptional regulator [Geminicoccaceae bacterium]|nr:LysR family transcriptional regulator [Geminicoccaceae bacterium]
MRNLDTALLRAFLTVAETGSMTRAAHQLNLTQAAVSLQVKRLEDALGQPLFERAPRGLVLLPPGERLLPQARRLLLLNDEIWTSMTAPAFEGELRLGVPHDIVPIFMPGVLRRFDQAWPRVQLSLVCKNSPDLLQLLDDGRLDLTLTTLQAPPPGAETLMEDRLVWVGALGGKAHLREPLPVSLGHPTCAFRPSIMAALDRAGRAWRSCCDTGEMQALVATIEADLGVGAMLRCALTPTLDVLDARHNLPELPRFSIILHEPPGGATPLARELARHLREGIRPRLVEAA